MAEWSFERRFCPFASIDDPEMPSHRVGMKAIFLLLLAAIASCSDGLAANQPPSRNRSEADATAIAKVMPRGWVTDYAGLLNPAQEASLSARLQAFEKASGHQLVVVTVRSLGGQDVAVFARELGKPGVLEGSGTMTGLSFSSHQMSVRRVSKLDWAWSGRCQTRYVGRS